MGKIKRFLLCFLAASMLSISASSFADNEEISEKAADISAEESSDTAKLRESEEKVRAEYADITEYLQKIGTVDGSDIYFKDKNIDDITWEKNGGKPDKKSDYTEEQKSLKDKIDDLKKLGDFVAVDPENETPVANFDDNSNCDEGKIYVSDGGRYLLYTDKELTKAVRIRHVVSTVDNPFLFSSADGKTLELMDSDYKKIIYTYTESGGEDGKKVFLTDDKSGFAWLSEDGTQVIGTYRICAENDSFKLLVDDRLGNIGVENKETGYIWWSSPLGATRDRIATPLLADELRSSNIVTYGIPSKRSVSTLRSASDDCQLSVKDIQNGVKITYKYAKGFEFPVEYTLEEDHVKASLRVSEIKETAPENIVTEITLMKSFGAADDTEDGYFIIPDGSGALVRFNNNKTTDANAYSQSVYGKDITAVPTSKGAVTEQIYLPMYGIVKEDNAMLAIASKGDSNAYISAYVSGQSNSSYNMCNFTFVLRESDNFYMSGKSNDKFTVFESGGIKSDDIELLYYPIAKENADYVDVAERYRNYLMENEGLTKKTTADSSQLYVSLYGGTQKKKPVLGVPVTMKQTATTYDEAVEILSELKDGGADDLVVAYKNWTDDGICGKIDTSAKPSGKLGGKSGFSELTDYISENGFELYPVSDNRDFYSGNGYGSFSDTSVRVSGSYSRIVSYDRAYGIPDGFKKNMSLLSPSRFTEICGEIAENYGNAGLNGVSVGSLTSSLYGDYGKKSLSRFKAMDLAEESFKKLSDNLENGVLADSANAYALPYVNHIINVPMSSSRFDIFNEDIPFYQMVMHGIVPYSTTSVNADADSETLLLMAAATGSLLSYDMLYEETSELKDTEFDVYFYANYENWTETAAAEYKLLKPIYTDVAEAVITGYDVENNGNNITTTYSNGSVVKVDFKARTIDFNGQVIDLAEAEKGGIRF